MEMYAKICTVLFLFLKFQTCCGNYDCFKLSSGKDICFMFEDTSRTFEESKQFCQNNGGFLLEIYDSEMQGFVEQFVKSKTMFLKEAWLNLMRINSNTWVWGRQSGNAVTYSNWGSDNPVSNGINQAFMNSIYRWFNSYNPHNASTICIQGSSASSVNNEPIQTSTSTYSNALVSSSSTGVGIGVVISVGLGVLVLTIVSSLLVAKFVFHVQIPFPLKSSRKSSSHQGGSCVNNIGANPTISNPAYENALPEDNNTHQYVSLSQPKMTSNCYEALRG